VASITANWPRIAYAACAAASKSRATGAATPAEDGTPEDGSTPVDDEFEDGNEEGDEEAAVINT
jgi:transcription elongation factor